MISKLQDRLGTAGFVLSIIALVAALSGGAYAASGGLTGKQKKEVTAIAKQYAGKPGKAGKTGATGPQGAAGSKGDTGSAGSNGTNGAAGSNGTNGASGKGVVTAAIPAVPGEECGGLGGTEVEVEGSGAAEFVCNGSPWTAGGTLPAGQTETGSWLVTGSAGIVSFAIPLSQELPGSAVHFVKAEETAPAACDNGTGPAASATNPEADPGQLCVFEGFGAKEAPDFIINPGLEFTGATGAATTGALLFWGGGTRTSTGTFAVTAES